MEQQIKEIIQKSLQKCLKEECKRNEKLLFERWSYSDEIDVTMDYIYNELSKVLNRSETHKIEEGIWLKRGSIENLTIFNISGIKFDYYVYVCSNDEMCEYILKEGYSENNYDETDKELVVTFYTVNGQLIEEPSNKNLSHELEHILQISKGSQKNKNYKTLITGAYNLASNIIANGGVNVFEEIIAWLIYYSNPHEQDAFMNEYYQDLRNHKQYINDENSTTYFRLKDYKHKANIFKNNVNNEKLLNALSRYRLYGYTIRTFDVMIDKGLHRFEKKMNNIEKHFKNIVREANQKKYRLKPIKNGSLRIL